MLIKGDSNPSVLGSTHDSHSSVLAIENKFDLEKQHKLGKFLKCFAKLVLTADLLFGAMFVWIYIASIVCEVIDKRYKMLDFWFQDVEEAGVENRKELVAYY